MKKIIIFDNDGVLVNSEPVYEKLFMGFLYSTKYKLKNVHYKNFVGSNFRLTHKLIKKDNPDFFSSVEEMSIAYREYVKDHPVNYKDYAMPNIKETLDSLKALGYHMAVASSGTFDHIMSILNSMEVTEYFEFVVSGYDFKESKPNPEIYLHAAERFGVDPKDIFVVEDSPYGLLAAKRAGMKVIAKKDYTFGFDQSCADYFIDDLLEVVDIVKSS